MTHREKLAHFETLLEARGFWKSNAMPPIFRLLWAFGAKLPPPYFLSFAQVAIPVGGGWQNQALDLPAWKNYPGDV